MRESSAAQEAFFRFLADLYAGALDPATVTGLAEARPVGYLILLAYEPDEKRLQVVDPLAGRRLSSEQTG